VQFLGRPGGAGGAAAPAAGAEEGADHPASPERHAPPARGEKPAAPASTNVDEDVPF
jgi:hypothetical protein